MKTPTQQDFIDYRNKLLKLRKEGLKEKRRQKMDRIFSWLKKNATWLLVIIIFLFLFSTTIVLQVSGAHKGNTKLNEANIQIEKLLKANNTLAQKLVAMKEQERRDFKYIEDYILWINKTVPPIVATETARNIIIASDKYDLPVTAIVAVMERESHFNPTYISKAGARGLMQVMPVHLKELNLKSRFDYHDIEKGINAGAYVLKKYLKKHNNNMKKALLQYVNYDKQYVKDVYNSMGKFVVFKGISNDEKRKEVILGLDEEEKPTTFTHTVIEGDTISLIAIKYTGDVMNWKKIKELNSNIIPKRMQIGSQVILPIEMKTET